MIADVNVMHTRIRRETILLNAMNVTTLLEEPPVNKTSPRKSSPLETLSDKRPTELTLPDSETFVPEFGLCLPPDLLHFDSDTPSDEDGEDDYALDLSDALRTPLSRTNDFNLPDYDYGLLNDGIDSGFGDASDGFDVHYQSEDDDVLRNVDDGANLNFNLDTTPPRPRKRGTREDSDDVDHAKRPRHISGDRTDDDVQQMAREDHIMAQQTQIDDWTNDIGGFGEPAFAEYQTPPPVPTQVIEQIAAPVKKKRRIVFIVEDKSTTIKDADFRAWPQKYAEMQVAAKERKRNIEMGRTAKENAVRLVWGWGGRSEKELPEAFRERFSRAALLTRWLPGENNSVDNKGKRKRVDDSAMEYAMCFGGAGGFADTGGFGDNGGFDNLDYSVCFSDVPLILGYRDCPTCGGGG